MQKRRWIALIDMMTRRHRERVKLVARVCTADSALQTGHSAEKGLRHRRPSRLRPVCATKYPREASMRFDRITRDPDRMNGQPCVRDLRMTVRRVVEIVAACPDRDKVRADYPELEDEDIAQALAYAAASMDDAIIDIRRAG
jgi:uncharacterized protein (DUF433 family)